VCVKHLYLLILLALLLDIISSIGRYNELIASSFHSFPRDLPGISTNSYVNPDHYEILIAVTFQFQWKFD